MKCFLYQKLQVSNLLNKTVIEFFDYTVIKSLKFSHFNQKKL